MSQRASGRQFDREYMSAMVANHEKTVRKFEQEASSGQDKNIRAYAKNVLPVIKQHLAEAQILASGGKRIASHNRGAAAPGTAAVGSGTSAAPLPHRARR